MFVNPTVNLRRGWSGGHSHRFGPNFIDFGAFDKEGVFRYTPKKAQNR